MRFQMLAMFIASSALWSLWERGGLFGLREARWKTVAWPSGHLRSRLQLGGSFSKKRTQNPLRIHVEPGISPEMNRVTHKPLGI